MVSPEADVQDGWLNFIYCEPISVLRRLLVLPRVEKGTHLSHPAVHHRRIQGIDIRSRHPVFAQIDGELVCADRFSISMAAVRLNVKCALAER